MKGPGDRQKHRHTDTQTEIQNGAQKWWPITRWKRAECIATDWAINHPLLIAIADRKSSRTRRRRRRRRRRKFFRLTLKFHRFDSIGFKLIYLGSFCCHLFVWMKKLEMFPSNPLPASSFIYLFIWFHW